MVGWKAWKRGSLQRAAAAVTAGFPGANRTPWIHDMVPSRAGCDEESEFS